MTILCVSGSRADYGYLLPVAKALGVKMWDMSDMTVGRDVPESIATRCGNVLCLVGAVIAKQKPRMMVVVGDRWEILSACQAAVLAGVPIAHIGAGERTLGAYDDKFRAAIEALAELRFALTMHGLNGKGHLLAGCTSVQPPAEIPAGDGTAIVALYPETAGDDLSHLLAPICAMLKERGLTPLVIGANPDVGASRFAGESLPLEEFHARLAAASLIIGNSSAGIIEAPILCTPTVNIGRRQAGRPQATGVFQADGPGYIAEATVKALAFGKQRVESPYYRPDAVQTIVNAIHDYLEK